MGLFKPILFWWYGIQLNPQFMGIDLKFFFVRAGMMGWLIINLSVLAKSVQDGSLSQSMILYQLFCAVISDRGLELLSTTFIFSFLTMVVLYAAGCRSRSKGSSLKPHITGNLIHDFYILDYFVHEEYMTSTYLVFRGANKQKHIFKQNPKALIWGKPPKVIGGKLLASGYWGIARHSNYLGDLLLALSFSLPCGLSSPIPYFYPIYLFILLVWRERRDEARCAEKYKDIWAEYCRLVPWRIFPYLY
ncbi:hypothetical protein GOBAR_AA30726 [Gossypium barbadense]|uniref:Delta(14)-sterol reductase n=1 Tax=Gossypium barbadense TaxID=3634 RepID=A0A2P5WFW3_GOSBA|nr:hypothetical protein GOBAR_AA30726 [Gossypium barbadense]